jgi:hypothetical protein
MVASPEVAVVSLGRAVVMVAVVMKLLVEVVMAAAGGEMAAVSISLSSGGVPASNVELESMSIVNTNQESCDRAHHG